MSDLMQYYTSVQLLSALALVILMLFVIKSKEIEKNNKTVFLMTYVTIILAMGAEWLSLYLNGAPQSTRILHAFAKSADYILTPIAGVLFIHQVSRTRSAKLITIVIVAVNTALQVVSAFTGWVFYIDRNNYYAYGKWHNAYVVLYFVLIAIVAIEFLAYSRKFKRPNRLLLYAIIFLTSLGIGFQELINDEIRTSYLSLTLGSIMLFIHYMGFNQQKKEDVMDRQKKLLETDSMTGAKSRHSYSMKITKLRKMESLPEDMVIFLFDLDGLKAINDTLGHTAGDEAICGAAGCIMESTWMYGDCYRTGGDEYVAILQMERKLIPQMRKMLEEEFASWRGWLVENIHVSYGWVRTNEYPEASIDELIDIADKRMYEMKTKYYKKLGYDELLNPDEKNQV